jgi:hypothetical protein
MGIGTVAAVVMRVSLTIVAARLLTMPYCRGSSMAARCW